MNPSDNTEAETHDALLQGDPRHAEHQKYGKKLALEAKIQWKEHQVLTEWNEQGLAAKNEAQQQ